MHPTAHTRRAQQVQSRYYRRSGQAPFVAPWAAGDATVGLHNVISSEGK